MKRWLLSPSKPKVRAKNAMWNTCHRGCARPTLECQSGGWHGQKTKKQQQGRWDPIPPTKRTRDKACQLRKFVDSHKQTGVSLTNRQRTDKIHGPLFKFNWWDRKRLQQAWGCRSATLYMLARAAMTNKRCNVCWAKRGHQTRYDNAQITFLAPKCVAVDVQCSSCIIRLCNLREPGKTNCKPVRDTWYNKLKLAVVRKHKLRICGTTTFQQPNHFLVSRVNLTCIYLSKKRGLNTHGSKYRKLCLTRNS